MPPEKIQNYLAAFATFGIVVLIGLTIGGLETAKDAIAEKEAMALFAEEVTHGGTEMLLDLNRSLKPACDEASLKEMRKREFRSLHVNDIAALDGQNNVICTSTLGVLDQKVPAFTPEYTFSADNKVIQVTDHARNYLTGVGGPVTMGRLGRFQVTLSPESFARMDSNRFTALGVINDDGSLTVIRGQLKAAGLKHEVAEIESRKTDWRKNGRKFNWQHLALETSYNVRGAQFVYFQRAPVYSSSATSGGFKAFLVSMAFALAMLTHAALVNWQAQRSGMRYRITRLLTKDNIRCVYQPIVDLATGRIAGCEVLVRLQDGDVLLTPDRFLPAVLERGLAWHLDQLVIERSLTDLRESLPRGETFDVALNLFPQNIRVAELKGLIQNRLGWEPGGDLRINLEVIEQMYHDEMLLEIAELKRLGYSVSVDDFGTGYSNLGSVRKLRPDFLKIDRSFVHEMETASVRSSLIPEIVAIARATGAAIIAEGIENEKQRDALRELGVEYGQGYFLGRPMALANLVALLNDQSRKVIHLSEWQEKVSS